MAIQKTRPLIANAITPKVQGIFSLLFLLALILLPTSAAAQAGYAISGQAVTPFGAPATNARITVCPYTATGTPCAPQSDIYSDSSLAAQYKLTQPYAADQYGNYNMWVTPATSYIVQVAINQTTTYSYLWTAGINSAGVVGSIIPGTNVTCTPLVSGTCVGPVTINATNPMVYPAAGLAASTGSAWRTPLYTDVTALWSSGACTGYLKSDGTCSSVVLSLNSLVGNLNLTSLDNSVVITPSGSSIDLHTSSSTTGFASLPLTYSGLTSHLCDGGVDSTGRAWFIENNGQLAIITKAGGITILSPANSSDANSCAAQGAFDASGNFWYAIDSGGTTTYVNEISPAGVEIFSFSTGSSSIQGMTLDQTGNVWVADNAGIQVFSQAGALLHTVALGYIGNIRTDSTGVIWALQWNGNNVYRISASTYATLSTTAVSTPQKKLVFDSSGNAWILSASALKEIPPTGTAVITSYAVPTQYFSGSFFQGLAIDSSNNLWLTGAGPSTASYTVIISESGYILSAYLTYNGGQATNGILIGGTTAWVGVNLVNTVTIFDTTLQTPQSQPGSSTNFFGPVNIGAIATATASANEPSHSLSWTGQYYNSLPLNDTWSAKDVLGSGTTPTSTLTFSHTGSTGSASVLFPLVNSTSGYQIGGSTVLPSTITGYQGSGTKVATPVYGYSTLASGTVTVSNAASCTPSATCVYKLTNCGLNGSTAVGTLGIGTVAAGTSFVINSESATATVITGDSSNVCWQIN